VNGQRVSSEDPGHGPSPVVTPEIGAEAAVWIARLHGPDRSTRMERECLAWQSRSAAHRVAFERCTETWQDVARVTLGDAYSTAGSQRSGSGAERIDPARRSRWAVPLVVAGCLSLCAVFIQLWRDLSVYSTRVGEQRILVLDDGTRLSLNTHSRVRVDLGASQRTVTVEDGEALFEVAKDPQRPFVVRAGGSEVVALGTVFSVRLSAGRTEVGAALNVTLIEGQVTVRAASGIKGGGDGLAPEKPLSMLPGERIRLVKSTGRTDERATQQVDRPRIEGVVAWKRSEAIFDDVPLAEAVAELNRYDRRPIVLIGDASLAQLRVSGIYRTGDTASFANAVAALHRLVVREREGRLELASPQ
jgi:transmembrane sensor